MDTLDLSKKEALLQELQNYSASFKTLGIEHEYNTDGSIEELETVLQMAQSFFGSITTSAIESLGEALEPIPVTVEILSEFIKDVCPEPKAPIAQLTAIANQSQDDLDASEQFENSGLVDVCELLSEHHLAMSSNGWDPYDLEYSLKLAFEKLNLNPIDESFSDVIEEKLLDFDDEEEQEEYVWHTTVKEVDCRGYELLELTPLDGIWSDKVFFIIKKELAPKWNNKAFGNYGLVSLTETYLDMDFE